MAHKIITPRQLPLDLPALRRQIKVDDPDTVSEEDALLTTYADQACDYAQHFTGRAIGEQTLEQALDAFPAGPIKLPFAPALKIESVRYVNPEGQWAYSPRERFVLDDFGSEHWLLPAAGIAWPGTAPVANAVRVRYVAGYSAASLPGAVRGALLLLTAHYYQHRGAASQLKLTEIPHGVDTLLGTVKLWGV